MKHLKSYKLFESTEVIMSGLENAIMNDNETLFNELINQYSDMIDYSKINGVLKSILSDPKRYKYLDRLDIPLSKISDARFMLYNIYRQIFEGVSGGGGATAIIDYVRYGELFDLIDDLENNLKSNGYDDINGKRRISVNKAELSQLVSKMSNYGSLKDYVNAILSTEHSENLDFYVDMVTKMKQSDTKEDAEMILDDFFSKFK